MFFFFFFNDTATTEIYTLSLHDALPISPTLCSRQNGDPWPPGGTEFHGERRLENLFEQFALINACRGTNANRSEEHTSELQSRLHLVCRLLLEKKKKTKKSMNTVHIKFE